MQIHLKKRDQHFGKISFVVPDEPIVKDISSEISEISKEYYLRCKKERLHNKKTLDWAPEEDKVEKYTQ